MRVAIRKKKLMEMKVGYLTDFVVEYFYQKTDIC